MTRDEFHSMRWGERMSALYMGKAYGIINVDFEEETIGLDMDGSIKEVSCLKCTVFVRSVRATKVIKSRKFISKHRHSKRK